MTKKRALKILDEALKPYRQRYAVDANLYKSGVVDPFAKRAYDRLEELDKASVKLNLCQTRIIRVNIKQIGLKIWYPKNTEKE